MAVTSARQRANLAAQKQRLSGLRTALPDMQAAQGLDEARPEDEMQIRGVDLNIRIVGEGTPFIWGHGMLLPMQSEDRFGLWDGFPKDIKLVRYDARGHGASQQSHRQEDYDFRNLALDMLAIADAIGAKQFIAGGGSLGCVTALYAALQAPDRIQALVLHSPGTAWETRPAQARFYKRLAIAAVLVGGRGLAALASRAMARSSPDWLMPERMATREAFAVGLSAFQRRTLWALLRAVAVNDLPPREELQDLANIPTIILARVGDPVHPVSSAQELHRLLPQSELFIAQGWEEYKSIPVRIRDFVTRFACNPDVAVEHTLETAY